MYLFNIRKHTEKDFPCIFLTMKRYMGNFINLKLRVIRNS